MVSSPEGCTASWPVLSAARVSRPEVARAMCRVLFFRPGSHRGGAPRSNRGASTGNTAAACCGCPGDQSRSTYCQLFQIMGRMPPYPLSRRRERLRVPSGGGRLRERDIRCSRHRWQTVTIAARAHRTGEDHRHTVFDEPSRRTPGGPIHGDLRTSVAVWSVRRAVTTPLSWKIAGTVVLQSTGGGCRYAARPSRQPA